MTIAEQLKQIRDDLRNWVQKYKGSAEVNDSAVDLFSALRTLPGTVRANVMFHSETKRGDFEEAGVVDRTYWVAVSKGRGLKLSPGDDLIEQSSGGPPLFDLLEEARQVVRNLEFDDATEVHVDYQALEPFQVEGWLLDAYLIKFKIGCQLPDPAPEVDPGDGSEEAGT